MIKDSLDYSQKIIQKNSLPVLPYNSAVNSKYNIYTGDDSSILPTAADFFCNYLNDCFNLDWE